MATDEVAVAAILESIVISVADEGSTAPGAVGGLVDGSEMDVASHDIFEMVTEKDPSQPPRDAGRAPLRDGTNGQGSRPATRLTEVPACPGAVPVETAKEPSELLEPPTIDTLKEWASRAFTDPVGRRVELPALATAYQSTNGLFINGKEAIRKLFEQRRKELCSSPERPDLKLSQEEALGWLLPYALGRQLLAPPSRSQRKAELPASCSPCESLAGGFIASATDVYFLFYKVSATMPAAKPFAPPRWRPPRWSPFRSHPFSHTLPSPPSALHPPFSTTPCIL